MRIGIDARIYPTGIWRYTKNLLRELAKIDDQNEYLVFLREDNFDKYQPPNKKFKKAPADARPYSFKEQILFCWQLWRANLDLVHFTNFNVPLFYPGKYVVTIHDLIHMSHSTFGSSTRNRLYYYLKRAIYSLAIRWVAWRASAVLVPSQATKDDIVKHLGANPEKVYVTHEGFDPSLRSGQVPKHYKSSSGKDMKKQYLHTADLKPNEYLLYVATMYPHKNHSRLIEAYQQLIETPEFSGLKLVLVGKVDYFSSKMREQVIKAGLEDKVILPNFEYEDGYVPDEVLQQLYADAASYVFPSLKEGFGIPVLEAQAHDLPVAASDIPSLREVGKDSVEYFDPKDVEEMLEVMGQVLRDKNLRTKLREKGKQNIQRFSWRAMAEQTLAVYNHLAI